MPTSKKELRIEYKNFRKALSFDEVEEKSLAIVNQLIQGFMGTTNKLETEEDKKGLISIFFIAFLSGFAALLTPCVFPMIPMTVSFFTKQSKTTSIAILFSSTPHPSYILHHPSNLFHLPGYILSGEVIPSISIPA